MKTLLQDGLQADAPAPPEKRLLINHWASVALTVLVIVLVVWSFVWVIGRPLRNDADLGDRTELTILHWGDRTEDEIVESLVASCQKAHPHLKLKRINATAGYVAKLQTMIAGGNPPDLFFWNSHMLADYVGQGIILPMDDYLAEDKENGTLPFDFDDLYPVTVDSFKFDGKVTGKGALYGLPATFTPLGFYYNKAIFDRAGIAYPSDNWTWDEFEQKARAIGRFEDSVGGQPREYYGAELAVYGNTARLYLQGHGLDFYQDNFEQVKLTDPEVIATLTRLRDWHHGPDAGRMLTSPKSTVNRGESAFITGKIGMLGPTGRWMVPKFRKIKTLDWDFVQMPRGPERNANLVYVAAWCISSQSKHPREAWEVAKHFARPDCQAISSRHGLALPTLRKVAEGPACSNPTMKPARDDMFHAGIEHSTAMQQPAEPEFVNALNVALDESVRMGTISVEDAMHRANREWQMALESPLRGDDFPAVPWREMVIGCCTVLIVILPVALFFWWKRRPKDHRFAEELTGMAMISPWIIGVLTFLAAPMILSFLLAFTKWSGVATLDHAQWVGTKNWSQMLFHDARMLRSMWVTVYYAILMVPLGQLTALGIAVLMSRDVKGIGIYRSVWYLPTVLAGVGMAVMWLWVFDGEHGLLNRALEPVLALFGKEPPQWFLADAQWFGVPAFVIMALWTTGGSMLIYLAGLQSIPKHLYEAAQIDGAGRWAQFRNITLPMLSPIILFNVIMAIIGSFQVFTQAFVMTNGGPGDATRFYVLYLYDKAFMRYDMGYASAMAWLLFVVVLLLTMLTFRSSRERVHYEGGGA